MTSRSTRASSRGRFATAILAFLAGTASASPTSLAVVPVNAGPVGIAELQMLLGNDLQFQMFDFEAKEDFCLHLGYVHAVDGQVAGSSTDRGLCNLAGPQRLIVMMQQTGDKRMLSFGLHDRDTGRGVTMGLAALPIGKDVSGWSGFRPEETIHAERKTTLLRWKYGLNPPHPGPLHEVGITIRLGENTVGTGNF